MGILALLMIFAELRFERENTYYATFLNVTGLEEGNFVRVAGVEVGKVKKLSIEADSVVKVRFATDPSVVMTDGTRAAVRYDNLIGGRYLALEEGAGGLAALRPGATIPTDRTQPALDLDALIGGFRPLFRALDPDQVNALSGQLIQALQGEGGTISSLLTQMSALTNTLADRDELVGQVIVNLNTVLDSLADQGDQFSKAVDSLSQLMNGLSARRDGISAAVASSNDAAATVADLLHQARPPLEKLINETDRSAGIVVADHAYFDDFLNTLPDAYRALARQGIYGDFFSFYLCEAVLKVNGKGGQPVFVKLAGQSSGRCAPK
jgi:phospholipid/cholesterol/gamma-HCH transport system substrate-binding protein